MKPLVLLLAMELPALAGAAQAPKAITLPAREAAKIYDSLRVLPFVRQEARLLRAAGAAYRQAADSLQHAFADQQRASQECQLRLAEQKRLIDSDAAAVVKWRSKARKRGVLNGLLAASAGVLFYFSITR